MPDTPGHGQTRPDTPSALNGLRLLEDARPTFGNRSARTLMRWYAQGQLPLKKVSGRWYTWDSFLALVDAAPDESLTELTARWRAERGLKPPAVALP